MAILPVSSVGLKEMSNISFAHKSETKKTNNSKGTIAPLSKTIPVVVLMTMNPSLLNTAATASGFTPDDVNENLITMVVPTNTPDIDEATYVIEPESGISSQDVKKAPYGWNLFLQDDIVEVNKGHNALGNFDMVYTNNRIDESGSISDVYIVQKSRDIPAKSAFHPPRVYKLMYHNIGRDKEFCGVITKEDLLDENGQYISRIEKEIRLDDDTAQKLIDLVTNHSKWKNNTFIKICETKSERLFPTTKY